MAFVRTHFEPYDLRDEKIKLKKEITTPLGYFEVGTKVTVISVSKLGMSYFVLFEDFQGNIGSFQDYKDNLLDYFTPISYSLHPRDAK